jgi:molybdopterin synthase catalytic subunit
MRAAIVEHPLNPAALMQELASTSHGAAVVFVGTVRDVNEDRDVTGLDYRAYVPMAEKEMAAILREAEARWVPVQLVCEHRVGELALGDASVVIVAAHPHRGEAFDACRYVIEELKKRVPIWKRERYVSGELAWVENGTRNAEAQSSQSGAEVVG